MADDIRSPYIRAQASAGDCIDFGIEVTPAGKGKMRRKRHIVELTPDEAIVYATTLLIEARRQGAWNKHRG